MKERGMVACSEAIMGMHICSAIRSSHPGGESPPLVSGIKDMMLEFHGNLIRNLTVIVMKTNKFTRVIATILGVYLILYAANQFFHIFPTSYGAMPDFARRYLDAVVVFLPALYIFEILVGIFLILNIWTPLIAIVLAPLSVSFMIFNFTNGDWNIISAAFVAILNLILLFRYWDSYKPLFK